MAGKFSSLPAHSNKPMQYHQQYKKFLQSYHALLTLSERIPIPVTDWKKQRATGQTTLQIFETRGIANRKRQAIKFEKLYNAYIIAMAGLLVSDTFPYQTSRNIHFTGEQEQAADPMLVKQAYHLLNKNVPKKI